MSTGPKPKLLGCESAPSRAVETIKALRSHAVTVNSNTARSILPVSLTTDGHEHLLSPHLKDPLAALDASELMATTDRMNMWLHRMGMSYRAVTGDPKDVQQTLQNSKTQASSESLGRSGSGASNPAVPPLQMRHT